MVSYFVEPKQVKPLATERKPVVLLEMRPALDGFAGIPQETRLLFRGLCMIPQIKTEGLIQASMRTLARGTTDNAWVFKTQSLPAATLLNRYSRVVISMGEKPYRTMLDKAMDWVERRMVTTTLTIGTLSGLRQVKTSKFKSQYFEDFVWRTMFAKTLPASDFDVVTRPDFRICSTPWGTMHTVGLSSMNMLPFAVYPKLDTRGADIFIGQTPYPGRVSKNTAMVIRYHDALPVFMPHTISDKGLHQATHFYALRQNVKAGAWFACVSEATRQDLLKLFPEAEPRAVTIHNMVSHHYHDKPASAALVPGILRSRLYEGDLEKGVNLLPKFFGLQEKTDFYGKHLATKPFRYLLIVSTIEPRKNHSRLMAAWEVLKADVDPDLKLVVVGTLGWEYKAIISSFREWIDRGDLFPLQGVPAPDLRVLYQHAAATVCPSLGEGFDFSGAEAMASGGVVVASDIPVHREVYADASLYFDPYATGSLVGALKQLIYAPDAGSTAAQLRDLGKQVAARYQPSAIVPQWEAFLNRVLQTHGRPALARETNPSASDMATQIPAFAQPVKV
jgi:glycosyltransferase involved in cell wall biosynthesis